VAAQDPAALVELGRDQSLLLQHPERLPQRGPADGEHARQFRLVELGSGGQGAADDQLPQVRVDLHPRPARIGDAQPALSVQKPRK